MKTVCIVQATDAAAVDRLATALGRRPMIDTEGRALWPLKNAAAARARLEGVPANLYELWDAQEQE